jgi:hypothetical protein
LPWLDVLDRHKITEDERETAKKVKTVEEEQAEAAGDGGGGKKVKMKPSALQIATTKCVHDALEEIKREVIDKRILLKEHFMQSDPRREWTLPHPVFVNYMALYGLDAAARRVRAPEGGDAWELVLKRFSKRTPPVRAPTMGRDTTVAAASPAGFDKLSMSSSLLQETRFIDYVAFCMAIEPVHNSRDEDNTMRLLANAQSMRLGPTVDDKVPLSNTVRNLNTAAEAYQAGLRRAAAEERAAMVRMSEEAARKQRAMRVPMAKSEEDFEVPENMLDAWELNELMNLVMTMEGYDKKTHTAKVRRASLGGACESFRVRAEALLPPGFSPALPHGRATFLCSRACHKI